MGKKTAVAASDPKGGKLGVVAALLRALREKKRPIYKFDGDGRR